MDTKIPQSSSSVLELLRYKGKESYDNLSKVIISSDFNSKIDYLEENNANYIVTGDWISLITLLDCARPGSKSPTDECCFLCNISKLELKNYFGSSDKFGFATINRSQINFPNSLLSSSKLNRWRYCTDHQNANLLNFVLFLGKILSKSNRKTMEYKKYISLLFGKKKKFLMFRSFITRDFSNMVDIKSF